MKVERQGPYECALATIAALSGKSLECIRQKALEIATRRVHAPFGFANWESFVLYCPELFYPVLSEMASEFGLLKLVEELDKAVCDYVVAGIQFHKHSIPEKGRGIVIVYAESESESDPGHVMPYEDGLVYDPGTPCGEDIQGITLEEWLKKNPEQELVKVIPAKHPFVV